MKKLLSTAAAFTLLLGAPSLGHAGLLDSYLVNGQNRAEDDSGENATNVDGGDAAVLEVGDILSGVLDFPGLNANTNLAEDGVELSGVFAVKVSEVIDTGTSLGGFQQYNVRFEAVTNTEFENVLGLDLSTISELSGLDTTSLVSLFFEDASDNLDLQNDSTSNAIANATDGDLVVATQLIGDDYFESSGTPIDLTAFSTGTAGTTTRGNFGFGLSSLYFGFSGELQEQTDATVIDGTPVTSDFIGTGTLIVSELEGFSIQNDAQVTFNRIPIPGSVALLGLGLVALGFAGRRFRV